MGGPAAIWARASACAATLYPAIDIGVMVLAEPAHDAQGPITPAVPATRRPARPARRRAPAAGPAADAGRLRRLRPDQQADRRRHQLRDPPRLITSKIQATLCRDLRCCGVGNPAGTSGHRGAPAREHGSGGRDVDMFDTAALGGRSDLAGPRNSLAHQSGQVPTLVQIWGPAPAQRRQP